MRVRTERFAVKVLAENWSNHDEAVVRFTAEATTMQGLRGPGILTVHHVGRTDRGQPFMALDLADLGSLDALVALQGGRLSDRVVGTVLVKTAQGLARAHQGTIAHRDLKPANILLRSRPGVSSTEPTDHDLLIGDFGVARALAEATRQTTAIAGTPEYMAPEQFEMRADRRSDVFALGVLAYWLLTGVLPFPQPREDLQYLAKRSEHYLPVDRLRPEFAGPLAELLNHSLSADPDGRPADADAWLATFWHALSRGAGGASVGDRAQAPTVARVPAGGDAFVNTGVGTGDGNVAHGAYARSVAVQRFRDLKAMSDSGLLTTEEFSAAKARLMRDLGLTDTAEVASPAGSYAQGVAQQLIDDYRGLVTEGVLSPAELDQTRRALLRQSGIV